MIKFLNELTTVYPSQVYVYLLNNRSCNKRCIQPLHMMSSLFEVNNYAVFLEEIIWSSCELYDSRVTVKSQWLKL